MGIVSLFKIRRSLTDIFCFKPDVFIGNPEKMYLEEEVSIPEECKIHIMSHKMPKDMQNEITNVRFVNPSDSS